MITEAIQKIVTGIDLTETEMQTAMSAVIDGKVTTSQAAAFVTALRMKGETVEEITVDVKNYVKKKRPVMPVHLPFKSSQTMNHRFT